MGRVRTCACFHVVGFMLRTCVCVHALNKVDELAPQDDKVAHMTVVKVDELVPQKSDADALFTH